MSTIAKKGRWVLQSCSLKGRRSTNQDVLLAELVPTPGKGVCLIVACDGMGGLPHGGDVASSCLAAAKSLMEKNIKKLGKKLFYHVAIKGLQQELIKLTGKESFDAGGTTFVMLAVCLDRFSDGYRAIVAWAGDSRAYVMDPEGNLISLTQDDHDEDGALTAYYDGASQSFMGTIHVNVTAFPHEPTAFGVTTDGFHEGCSAGELSAFLAWFTLEGSRGGSFEEAARNFLEYNLSDNAGGAFAFRTYGLHRSVLRKVATGERA